VARVVDGYLRASLIGAIPICSNLSQTIFVLQMRTKVRSCVRSLSTLWPCEEGQDVAEYAVMMAVILVIVASTVKLIGVNAGNVFSQVGSAIQ
jgi:Flp pilus assembly pilin Flp